MVSQHPKRVLPLKIPPSIILSILLVLLVYSSLSRFGFTGYLILRNDVDYANNVSIDTSKNFSYTLSLNQPAIVKSLSIDGAVSKSGMARVYLEYGGRLYLVFDSRKAIEESLQKELGSQSGGISGPGSSGINSGSAGSQPSSSSGPFGSGADKSGAFSPGNPPLGGDTSRTDTSKSVVSRTDASGIIASGTDTSGKNASSRSVTLNLRGGGRKDFRDIFAFIAEGKFDWNVDYSKLCTRWDVNGNTLCYGAEECCSLIDLSSIGGWNDTLYLSYGRYESALNNSIRAQMIYANFSLESGNAYSDVRYSEVKTAEAEFYEEAVGFTDVCIDTCLLPGFNISSLKLIFEVEDANISLYQLRYSFEREIEVSRNSPSLVREIKDVVLFKNESIAVNLSGIFEDKDGDALNYSAESVENLSIIMGDSAMLIIPDINFTGRRKYFVSASDGYYTAYSNAFVVSVIEKPLGQAEVNVSETILKPRVVINRPVRWVKIVNASSDVANLTVNISSDALNVTVRDISRSEGSEDIMGVGESSIGGHMELISEDKIKINDGGELKGPGVYKAEKRIEQIEKAEDRLEAKKADVVEEDPTKIIEVKHFNQQLLEFQNERNQLTGYVVASSPGSGFFTKLIWWLFNVDITGFAVLGGGEPLENSTSVIVKDIVNAVEVEYYTEAPVAEEENLSSGKRIVISSEVHYEDILAYTELAHEVPEANIELFWLANDSKLQVPFDAFDTNGNGLTDYIEWIVPSLSNQTYELSLNILNVQSYPEVGHTWVVSFNATGTANLTISAISNTTFSEIFNDNVSSPNDLRPVDLRCGETIFYSRDLQAASEQMFFVIENGSELSLPETLAGAFNLTGLKVVDFSCNGTANHTVKVLTAGVHDQQFTFGNITSEAHNHAAGTACDGTGSGQNCGTGGNSSLDTCIDTDASNTVDTSDYCHDDTQCLDGHIGASCNYYNGFSTVQGICAKTGATAATCSMSAVSGEYGTGITGGTAITYHSGNENSTCSTGSELMTCDSIAGYDPAGDGMCMDDACMMSGENVFNCLDQDCSTGDVNDAGVYQTCDSAGQGFACDSVMGTTGFQQDGICGSFTAQYACRTSGYLCNSSVLAGIVVLNGCDGGTNCANGDPCDATLTDGNFNKLYGTCSASGCDAVDTTPPSYSGNKDNSSSSTPVNGTIVQLNITVKDNSNISFFRLTVNDTVSKAWANGSLQAASGNASFVFNYTISNFTIAGGILGWKVWANDTKGNVNESAAYTLTVKSQCGNLASAGTYTLVSSVSATGTCFTIGADNVALDCAGYNVTYKAGGASNQYGVNNENGYDNVNVTNCKILAGSEDGNNGWGIFFSGVTGSSIVNNNITTNGTTSNRGISLSSSPSNKIFNNTINSRGSTSSNSGILIYSSNNNNLSNNIITTDGSSTNYGIAISSSSSNLLFTNTISTAGGTDSHAFNIDTAATNNNNFTSNTLNSIAGKDLNFATAGINGTWLIDQPIRSYAFTGAGGTINVKNSTHGVIQFISNVSGSGTNLFGNSTSAIKISNNSLWVNATNLNASANLTLYNMDEWSFTKPYILKDGANCDQTTASQCFNFTALTVSTVTFNVTSWSNYSIGDIPDIAPGFSANQDNSSSSTPVNSTIVQLNLTITDDVGLSFYRLTVNDTANGAWANGSLIAASGTSVTAVLNYTISNFSIAGGTLGWKVWVNDTSGNVNESAAYTLTVKSQCGNLGSAGTYTLVSSVSATGTCFTFSTDNVTLDCAWNIITFGTSSGDSYGITTSGTRTNLSIKRCDIVGGNTTSDHYGIYFNPSSNSIITNTTIATRGVRRNYGIYMKGGSFNNTIANSSVSTYGSDQDQFGIFLDSVSANTNITNVNVSTTGIGINNYGIYAFPSRNLRIENSRIKTNGTSDNVGIFFRGTSNSTVINNTILTNGTSTANYGIQIFANSDNNVFSFNNISTVGGNSHAFHLKYSPTDDYPENNTISNNTLYSVAGNDLNIATAGINNTWLIDQPIRSYAFTGAGGTLNLKNSTHGLIQFISNVSGSGTNLFGNATSSIKISNNSIFVNATNLNASANITLYNMNEWTFTSPYILKDGANCDQTTASQCFNFTALTASTITFNVTTWSNYSIGEFVDTSPPAFASNQDNSSSTTPVNSTIIQLNLTITDDTGISFYRLEVNDTAAGTWANGSLIAASGTSVTAVLNYTISNFSIAGGTLGWKIWANDTLGYASESSAYNLTVKSQCGNLGAASVYKLVSSVTASGTCFTVGSDNVTLDCAGNTITYKAGGAASKYGVDDSGGYDNVNITNCNIVSGNSSGNQGYAVSFNGVINSKITSNNITTNGTYDNYGIYFQSSTNNTVFNNLIITNGSSSSNNGIYLSSSSDRNNFTSNNITTRGSTENIAFYFNNANNNTLYKNTIQTSGGTSDGLFLTTLPSENNSLQGNTFNAISGKDLNFGTAGINNTLLIDQPIRSYSFFNAGSTIRIKNSTYGMIEFLSNISGSGSNLYGNSSSSILFANNSIIVNATNLNASANLTLYNMNQWSFTKPYILKDGANCDQTTSSQCFNFTALTASTITFNVTTWSNYSIGEFVDTVPPAFASNQDNSSSSTPVNSTIVQLNLTITDDTGISFYRLTVNDTATKAWANGSLIAASGTSVTAVLNYTISNFSIAGGTLGWKLWANDTLGYAGESSAYTLTVKSQCGTLGAGMNYTLLNNVSASATCFTVNGANIKLDCASYKINYSYSSAGYGVDDSGGFDNISIKNCLIVQGAANSGSHGILFDGVSNSAAINNSIFPNATSSQGIRLASSTNNNLTNNTVRTTAGTNTQGVYLTSSSTNILYNNNLSTGGATSPPVYMASSNSNELRYNILLSLSSDSHGVFIDDSSNNLIINNSFNTSSGDSNSIWLRGASSSNIAENNTVLQSGGDAFNFAVTGTNYPSNNTITGNVLNNIGGNDLEFASAGINGTLLIDQPIRNYSFTGAGGTLKVKNSTYGLIEFFKSVSGSGGNLFGNSTSPIRITNNSLWVNTTNLNTSANLTLYNMDVWGFSSPSILKDGVACSQTTASQCFNFTALTASTVTFNVTSWSNYSIGETPDVIPPNYTSFVNNGSELTLISGIVNWSVYFADGSGISGYKFAHNQTGTLANGSFILGNYSFINNTLSITAAHAFICGQYWFNDTANNINQTNLSCFTVANSVPLTPSINSPANNELNNTRKIDFNTTDADSDAITFRISINGSLNISTAANISVWNGSDGTYSLKVSAWDGLNSSANTSAITFTLDSTAPTVSISYPTNNRNISSASIALNGTSTDNIASSLTYFWLINGTTNTTTTDANSTFNASNGYYNLTLKVSDSLQNGSATALFTLDNQRPAYSGFGNNASANTFINGIVNWSIALADNFALEAYSFAHNQSGTLTNVTSGRISGLNYSINNTLSITAAHAFICGQYWFNDTANNINQTNLSCFTVANSVPLTPSINSPANNELNNTRKIDFNTTDADSDAITFRISINGSLNISTASNISVWNGSDGTYSLKVSAWDGLNSSANTSALTFTLDSTAPAVSIIYPTNNRNISSASIALNGTSTDNIASSLTYFWLINGTTNTTTTDANSTFNASNGYYNLTLKVSDSLQNGSAAALFTLDTVNPSVNSISISPSVGAAGTVFNLTVNISDDISVLNATASIQKPDENQTALIILSLSSGLYNGSWNSSGSGDGSYVVDITAYDSSGNSVEKENGAVIPLSTNAVNVSVNSSINLTSEVPVIINATAQTDTWINITSNADSNASVAVAKYSDNIESVENTEGTELGKYLSIIVDNVTNRNISSAVIKVYYTDAEIAAKNLQESTLRLYKFNATSEIWVLTGNSGVDTANNFAYGNVTSFSSFGIFGTLISAASSASSSSAGASKAGGVCTPKWDCTGWGECLPEGKMTRSCTRVGTCFMGDRPEEEKRCEYIQEKQIPELNQEAKSPDIKEIEKEQFAPPNLLPFRIIYIPLIAFTVIIISNWARRRKGK